MIIVLFSLFSIKLLATRYEAEDAKLSGDATVKTSETGYSGTGYVEIQDDGGITFTINIDSDGFYDLVIGFNAVYGDKNQNLVVNGQASGEVSFPSTSEFTSIVAAKKVHLNKGSNTIEITASWGWQLFDYIELAPFEDSPFDVSSHLVNPNAIPAAVELYQFLQSNFLKRVVSGVMTLQGSDSDSMKEPNWLYENVGKYPALVGLDFMHQTGKESEWYYNDPVLSNQVVRDATDYYNRGGIPALCWHWRDPSGETGEFYSPSSGNSATEFDAEKAATSGTTENQQILKDLDTIAEQLGKLNQKGIPVLWRPFHEAAGGWFWWGYKGSAPLKALWKIMYDRFTNTHKLNNLIWVWTSDTAASASEWYPGDEFVDIVGADIYPNAGDHNSQVGSFEKLKEIFKAKKIIALSECGSIPDPEEIVTNGAYWSYFMPWYREYVIPNGDPAHNSLDFWKKLLGHSSVVTLDKMPGWKSSRKNLRIR